MKRIALTMLMLVLCCATAQAKWYAGGGVHGFNSDKEHDGPTTTEMSFLGPRLYAGRRLHDWFALETEVGRASGPSNVPSTVLT